MLSEQKGSHAVCPIKFSHVCVLLASAGELGKYVHGLQNRTGKSMQQFYKGSIPQFS